MDPNASTEHGRWSRRKVLAVGLGAAAVAGAGAVAGIEMVAHGALPGKQTLDRLDGACSVTYPAPSFSSLGPSLSGAFHSAARNRRVGYTVAYPPGHGPGSALPLIVMLHGFGGNHANALADMSPAQAMALRVDGRPIAPMAMVTVDGGGGYWNPHPGDDPMAMVVDELVPMCQRLGLGAGPQRIGTMGISMGGYGALRLAERYPDRFAAVAAISPAVWTSYSQAEGANPGAFASAASFRANDVIDQAPHLDGRPVRIASGVDDPFHPGVVALARVVPTTTTVVVSAGCHTDPFFASQEPPSLVFLSRHLVPTA
ncbi:MAG TPA: alpha/beta fold hydrolase [Acidimicrobiales bacterium]